MPFGVVGRCGFKYIVVKSMFFYKYGFVTCWFHPSSHANTSSQKSLDDQHAYYPDDRQASGVAVVL